MKLDEAGQILRLLTAGFHRETLEQETIDLWVAVLEPMDAEAATQAALRWVHSADQFPTINQFRHAYRGALPSKTQTVQEVPLNAFGLPQEGQPEWVRRWVKARANGDMRVFPEQLVTGPMFHDDPRYAADASDVELMPEDAWA